jgi:hypothetical protein
MLEKTVGWDDFLTICLVIITTTPTEMLRRACGLAL